MAPLNFIAGRGGGGLIIPEGAEISAHNNILLRKEVGGIAEPTNCACRPDSRMQRTLYVFTAIGSLYGSCCRRSVCRR